MRETRFPFGAPAFRTRRPRSITKSVAWRCNAPIMTGRLCSWFSTQAPSQSASTGQTRAQEWPSTFASRIVRAEPFRLPVVIFRMKPGMSMAVGQAWMQGAS